VPTKRLNQQVHRNLRRFPDDFMFQLTAREAESIRLQNATLDRHLGPASLRFQNATSKRGKYRKYLPFVFTEHGAIMLAAVLKTDIAIEASIQIARAFGHLRELLTTHKELARKLAELEKKYDSQFKVVFDAIRQLMEPAPAPKPPRLPPVPKVRGFTAQTR